MMGEHDFLGWKKHLVVLLFATDKIIIFIEKILSCIQKMGLYGSFFLIIQAIGYFCIYILTNVLIDWWQG